MLVDRADIGATVEKVKALSIEDLQFYDRTARLADRRLGFDADGQAMPWR
jgi:hypothetical protein